MPIARPLVRLATDRLPAGPWIYGRQVEPDAPGAAPENGTLVEVADASGRFVGHALYNGASDIRLRMLARGKKTELDQPRQFLERRIAAADRLRTKRLRLPETTDAYRIVHAEGDDLPGLIIDRLGPALVCEHHSLGFWRLRDDVEWVLGRLYPGFPVVHRVPKAARRAEGFEPDEEPSTLPDLIEVRENEIVVPVRPGHGHKTGYFCDQRDNRLLVGKLAAGVDVLDLCCNSGGFALQAARLGARHVRAVDLDEQVLELAREAGVRNGLPVVFEHADAFDVLRAVQRERRRPGLVVLDPHKLVRNAAGLEEGVAKYGDMNALALGAVAPGGLVATFSCSGKVDLAMFVGIVFQAARRAGRSLRLLQTLGAGPDHPQRPEFSRSRYLKGVLACVD